MDHEYQFQCVTHIQLFKYFLINIFICIFRVLFIELLFFLHRKYPSIITRRRKKLKNLMDEYIHMYNYLLDIEPKIYSNIFFP